MKFIHLSRISSTHCAQLYSFTADPAWKTGDSKQDSSDWRLKRLKYKNILQPSSKNENQPKNTSFCRCMFLVIKGRSYTHLLYLRH